MNLGSALGIPQDVFRYVPDKRLILPECRVGVEFEYEGVHVSIERVKEGWTKYFKTHLERSLHDAGSEFVFSQPLFGADVIEAVTKMCEWARANKFKVSIRTGLHVHIDVRDLTRDQLVLLNMLYALFERAYYRIAGNNREENVFCMPWYKADHMQSHVININSAGHNIKEASEALENEKYGGLNLDTLARFGSVENRIAQATTDEAWIFQWINVTMALKRAAQKLDVAPLTMLHNLSAIGVENFARQVFEDQFDVIWYPGLEQDVWNIGIETALAVMPKAQKAFDKATLSWNRKGVPGPAEPVNARFKAFVEKHAKPKSVIKPAAFLDLEAHPFEEPEEE